MRFSILAAFYFSISFLFFTENGFSQSVEELKVLNKKVNMFPDSLDGYHQKILNVLLKTEYSLKDSLLADEVNNYLAFLYGSTKYTKLNDLCDKLLIEKNSELLTNPYGSILYYKSFLNYQKGSFDEAEDLLKKSVHIFELTGSVDLYTSSYLLGIINFSKGKYVESTKYLFSVAKSREDQGTSSALDSIYISGVYGMIGRNYTSLSEFKKAKKYLLKAQDYSKGRLDHKAVNLIYLGILFDEKGDCDEAIKSFKEAKKVITNNDMNLPVYLARIFWRLGNEYIHTGKLQLANNYLDSAIQIAQTNNLKTDLMNGLLGKGEIYFKNGNYHQAIKYFHEALLLTNNINNLKEITHLNLSLSKSYAFLGNHKQAYKYLNNYRISSDSLFNLKKTEQILNISEKYESEKKQQEIELLAKDKKLLITQKERNELSLQQSRTHVQNLILIVVLFALSIGFLLFYLRNRIKKNKAKLKFMDKEFQLKKMEAKFEGQEKERNRLSSELHDGIGSSILALKMSLDNKNNNNLKKELNSIYQEVREVSHDLRSPYFKDVESIDEMTRYLIKDTLLLNNISVDYLWFPENQKVYLKGNKQVMFYRVLQEVFTNIIKHSKTNRVEISYTLHEDLLNLIIADNGRGFNINESDWKKGIGIQNIYTRITTLKSSIVINSSENHGTEIVIDLPTSILSKNNDENKTESSLSV